MDMGHFVHEIQDIHKLQTFVTVVEEGSLSAAVNRLHITQPALSARLKLLEESLGCQLLIRTGRGVKPTAIGKLVYEISRDIVKRIKHLQQIVSSHRELAEGFIALAGDGFAIDHVFIKAIGNFNKTYPNVNFALQQQDGQRPLASLLEGEVDMAVTMELDAIPKDMDTVALWEYPLYPVVSKNHPLVTLGSDLLAAGKRLLPLHLNQVPWILYGGDGFSHHIEGILRQLLINPKITMNIQSVHTAMALVRSGGGLGLFPGFYCENQDDLVVLNVDRWHFTYGAALVTRPHGQLSPAAQKFLHFLPHVKKQQTSV